MLDITAAEIEQGDFIPGLGDAYVAEVEHDSYVNSFTPYAMGAIGDGLTVVTFHDADGNENYMILHPDCRLEVQR